MNDLHVTLAYVTQTEYRIINHILTGI